MPDTCGPLPLPIIVGVSGHRDIDRDSTDIDTVCASVRKILRGLRDRFGKALHVMTALTAGTDQLVAREARKLRIPLVTILPMPKELYVLEMKGLALSGFEKLWQKSALKMTLPFLPPIPACPDLDYEKRHYQQLAAFLARRSHILLALWDGADDPTASGAVPKPGGTGDVVRFRIDMGHAAAVERHSPLFAHSGSPLDALRPGFVVCVSTPRRSGTAPVRPGSRLPARPGSCFMLQVNSDPAAVPPICTWSVIESPSQLIPPVEVGKDDDFSRLCRLNKQIGRMTPAELALFKRHVCFLKTDPITGSSVDMLKRFQATADTAAQHYQRRLIGSFSALKISSLPGKILTALNDARHGKEVMPWPNVLTNYGLLLPLLVLLFESYSKLHSHWGFLLAYFLLSITALSFYKGWITKKKWQDNWQDYRAIAEALRVQLYWSMSGLPLAVGDNYLRKQDAELGWIKFALQGPALWATAQALSIRLPDRDAVMRGWVDDQARWFIGRSGKAQLNEAAAKRNDHFAKLAYSLGLIAVFGLLLSHALEDFGLADLHCVTHTYVATLHAKHVPEALEIFAVTMSAIAAYLTLMTNLRAYEAHARSYWQMGTAFRRARTIAKSIPPSTDPDDHHAHAFQSLMREIGRESLAETAEWLMDHRDRRVEPPS